VTSLIRSLRDVPADVALGTELVREYVVATAQEVGQDVEIILGLVPDLHDFAGRYFHGGAFLVAETDETIAGAVGVTPYTDARCEMNRLWTRPGFRRSGLGRALCEASMDAARNLGFRQMTLDVVPGRTHAIALYRSLGFVEVPPAHDYPFEMVFLGREL
jgi:putative acetyltransferase